jgi:hypothetical protein
MKTYQSFASTVAELRMGKTDVQSDPVLTKRRNGEYGYRQKSLEDRGWVGVLGGRQWGSFKVTSSATYSQAAIFR